MENKVLAVVNNREIKESDVQALLQNLGPNAARYQGEQGHKQLVEQLILEEMLYSDAVEQGIDTEDKYLATLEQLKKSLLAQYSVSKLLESVTVTEEEINEYYEKNKEAFKSGEAVEASHILVKTEQEANDIKAEIAAGLSFEEAAQKYSSCPSNANGGSLGKFGRGQMVPEFENAAFVLEVGKVSEPVQTQFGYHLIKVTQKEEAKELTLNEVREEVINRVKFEKQNVIYSAKQNLLKEKYPVEYK